ncbi:MAG: dTMP kinase [Candidatus Nanosalina sp.]
MRENTYPGTLIVVEGADGAGTTTQSEKLAEALDAHYTAEPTDNPVGEKVSEMISTGEHSPESIALAFAGDRILHLEEEVIPRLENGETVVMDRYYHSSLVYQPALGADYSWVEEINREAVKPDLTILLDILSREALSRIKERESDISQEAIENRDTSQSSLAHFSSGEDIFENLNFQEEVLKRYRKLADSLDEEIAVVDASPSIEKVFDQVKYAVRTRTSVNPDT